ncbi:unnamed protein product [Cuscuta epithymum]|uniref:Uncharacterized protein n=1 Tax=Cuscuta epithymum TaxID=186058 RepID=A0AAV0F3X9_9ASTE|nr:unnamed protein product [Cuscuta epithymum]
MINKFSSGFLVFHCRRRSLVPQPYPPLVGTVAIATASLLHLRQPSTILPMESSNFSFSSLLFSSPLFSSLLLSSPLFRFLVGRTLFLSLGIQLDLINWMAIR